MSPNSSSFLNASLPSTSISSNMPLSPIVCFATTPGLISISAFTFSSILFLLPLYVLVLYLGFQRLRQQGVKMTTSHSDHFTYQMVIIELLNTFGSISTCCAIYSNVVEMLFLGVYLFNINNIGQISFHTLTCVERYLAVVHPVTYLSLKTAKGPIIRNIAICCVWLVAFVWTGLMTVPNKVFILIITLLIIGIPLVVVSFCSLSVLYVLIRPGPGQGGKGQTNQSKLKAFYTLLAILGVLMLKLGENFFVAALSATPLLSDSEMKCFVWTLTYWFSMPSSLVLPLLFLQRAGKLWCCKTRAES